MSNEPPARAALFCALALPALLACGAAPSPQAPLSPQAAPSPQTAPSAQAAPSPQTLPSAQALPSPQAPPSPSALPSPATTTKWRSALERYTPSVTPGNQRMFGAALTDYARYLNDVHNHIHPVFMGFLESLDKLPAESPLNDKNLVTRLEIVLRPDGRILKMGVVKSSGNEDMDALVLEALDRAAPFAPVPPST